MRKNVQDTFRSVNGFVATTTLTPFSRRLQFSTRFFVFSFLFFIYVTHNFTPAWSNSCRRFTTSSYTFFIFFPFCFYMLVTFLNFVHISSFYVQCFVWDWLPFAYIWRSLRTFAFPLSILLYFHAFFYQFDCKSHQQLYSLQPSKCHWSQKSEDTFLVLVNYLNVFINFEKIIL